MIDSLENVLEDVSATLVACISMASFPFGAVSFLVQLWVLTTQTCGKRASHETTLRSLPQGVELPYELCYLGLIVPC